MRTVFREEKKYLITYREFRQLDYKLSQCLHGDTHNREHGYPIRSLYFDSIYDKDYFEKLAGIEIRRKIRLRIYDTANDFAMLEMKQKQGQYQKKRSLRLKREDAIRLTKGDYLPLLDYDDDFAAECYAVMHMQGYRPKTVMEYQRKAYTAKENKIRITFDSNLVSTESRFDIFDPKLMMNSVMDKSAVILEVKYNGFLLPYIKDMLRSVERSETSVSKYFLARQNGYLTKL